MTKALQLMKMSTTIYTTNYDLNVKIGICFWDKKHQLFINMDFDVVAKKINLFLQGNFIDKFLLCLLLVSLCLIPNVPCIIGVGIR